MSTQPNPGPLFTPVFSQAIQGQRPSAGEYNKIMNAVKQLLSSYSPYLRKMNPEIIQLTGYDATTGFYTGTVLKSPSDIHAGGASSASFSETIPADEKTEIFDVLGTIASASDMIIAFYHHQSGYYIPIGGGGGSGAPVIMFVITDIIRGAGLNCNAVEADVLNVSCDAAGVNVGDSVEVWDSLGCIFNCPMDLLIGVRGYATRMTTPDSYSTLALEQFDGGPQPETPCRWEVTTLCCVE